MTEETALKLIEAMNRFSSVLERMSPCIQGGIQGYHTGNPWATQSPYQTQPAMFNHQQYNNYGPAYRSQVGGAQQ